MKKKEEPKVAKFKKPAKRVTLRSLGGLVAVALVIVMAYSAAYTWFVDHLTNVPDWTPKAVAAIVVLGLVAVAYCFGECDKDDL